MKTKVNTGGLKTFVSSDKPLERDLEAENRIDNAYERVRKRKKRNKIITWTIIILLVLVGAIYLWRFK
jgi:hypothetical protein